MLRVRLEYARKLKDPEHRPDAQRHQGQDWLRVELLVMESNSSVHRECFHKFGESALVPVDQSRLPQANSHAVTTGGASHGRFQCSSQTITRRHYHVR